MSDNTITLEDVIAEVITADVRSPYGMMKEVNEVLAKVGLDKVLPGPMFYTYTKKGYIKTEGGKVTQEEAIRWTTQYVTKQLVAA